MTSPTIGKRTVVSAGKLGAEGLPATRATGGHISLPIGIVLVILALVSIAAPLLLVHFGPVVVPSPRRVAVHRSPARIVPPAELPPVEPLTIQDMDPDEARAFNAAVPFSGEANPAARPFRIGTASDDTARAVDCLAAGVYYEAGDDAIGERAVAQVVINRVRHPAFPKTICGVVFQGSERSTGCQFTFTCDGSIARRQPSDIAWARARHIATLALNGAVDPSVGWATHYHADFVVPYWQSSLDKLAEVHTQLFYRWSGWWGTPLAFRGRLQPGEPVVSELALISEAHRPDDLLAAATAGIGFDKLGNLQASVAPSATGMVEDGSFLVALPIGLSPDGYPALAATACGDRPFCRYLAWRDPNMVPIKLPLDAGQIASLGFSYVRDRSSGYDKSLWNCRETVRRDRRECMKPQVLLAATPAAATTTEVEPVSAAATPAALPKSHGASSAVPQIESHATGTRDVPSIRR